MILPAKLSHLPQIYEIEKLVFDDPWPYDQFISELTLVDIYFNFVYFSDKLLAAYLFGWGNDQKYHLTNFAVHPKFRNQKIGSKLLDYTLNFLIKNDVKTVLLEVNIQNYIAQNLYLKRGFCNIAIKENYYENGDHALLYKLELTTNG